MFVKLYALFFFLRKGEGLYGCGSLLSAMCEFSSLIRLLERGVFFFFCVFHAYLALRRRRKKTTKLIRLSHPPPLCKPVYDNVTR